MTLPLGGERILVQLKGPAGSEAWCIRTTTPGLVINEAPTYSGPDPDRWHITHVNTGLHVGLIFPTWEAAKRCAEDILFVYDWSVGKPQDQPWYDDAKTIIRNHPAYGK